MQIALPRPSVLDTGRRAVFWTIMVLLALAAWAALWAWSASPYARYLEHAGWGDAVALAELCKALPQGSIVVPAALHASAWVLMIAAMMLPTTFPLLAIFHRMTRGRDDAGRLLALVVLGFFVAWLAFGVVAHAADLGVRFAAGRYPGFATYGWLVGALVLAAAGAFQWSALKYRCLEACRTPFGFVTSRWHGRSPWREAFRIGIDHGLFCVGCCWALMLMMFVVGVGSIAWMLALAALMAAEKNLVAGRWLRTPVGVGLLGASATIVIAHL